MKNLISYSLFNYENIINDRWWDSYKTDLNRYFFNIPFILIQLNILYPDYKVVFYIEETIDESIKSLIKLYDNSFINIIKRGNFGDMSKSTWRYYPIFEDFNLVFPRDIDSVISKEEVECYYLFEKSNDYDVMTIRSNKYHNHVCCKMLAGQSGFKPQNLKLDKNLLKKMFHRTDVSCDQDFLIETFLNEFFMDRFIDFQIHDSYESPNENCKTIRIDNIQNKNENMYDIIKNNGLCPWAGYPCDSRKSSLKELMKFYKNIKFVGLLKSYIENNKQLKHFYL